MNKAKQISSMAVLFLAAIIWGFAFSAQKIAAANGVGSFTFNGIRFIIGGISLIPVILLFDKEKFINNIRWGEKACMVFQVDITNVKSEEHPLEWFPKSGETKTVDILVDCALGSHGEFCPVKMAIL
jgi:hypothetical protein